MRVLKFGGSSLATPERLETVAGIVANEGRSTPVAVVVSALGGVTDMLATTVERSAAGDASYDEACEALSRRHVDAADVVVAMEERGALHQRIGSLVDELRDLCHGVSLLRECTPRTMDLVLSYGERLSAMVVAGALRRQGMAARDCDARTLIVTDGIFGAAQVALDPSEARIRDHFASHDGVQVVTGFIGATTSGETTTLGRGGSDFTAALVGAALGADRIEIWTDVDGVMSADPRFVPDAFPLHALTYDELMELSHFGAKVVYPPSVHPARSHAIPLVIRNTLNPPFAGTTVAETADPGPHRIRGISSINHVALLRLEGDGMVGVPGIAMRLFGALARQGINVILISQASSEHSICFAVQPAAVEQARTSVEAEFALERRAGLINELVVERDLAVIAAVGSGMRERAGIASRLFGVLGRRGINVRAIAQGSSELNISLVLDRADERPALAAIHQAFFTKAGQRAVSVLVAGVGRVGRALLEQLASAPSRAEAAPGGKHVRVVAVCNSRHMMLARGGLDPASWRALSEGAAGATHADLDQLVTFARELPEPCVLVDCTASDAVPARYLELLEAGVSVVTANKRPFAGPLATFRGLERWRRSGGRGLYYEATVGAGLPVVRTLQDLLDTGDVPSKIEGVFSGTAAFLMSRLRAGEPLSAAVRAAHERAYTEPDPREDLSGMDVARKLLILARTAGMAIEPADVEVEPLVPGDELAGLSLEAFWQALPRFDAACARRQCDAAKQGRVLAYLARLGNGRARVALEAVKPQHPCGTIAGTDNVFALHTARYDLTPLVVRGPGAGPAVTAAGLFADVLRATASAPADMGQWGEPERPGETAS